MLPATTRLTLEQARDLTEEVKADAAALWAKLLVLYEGGAHIALSYSSWADYCRDEFDMGKSHAYRVLDAARVVNALPESPIGERPSESVARELAPVLKSNGAEAVEQVWGEVVAEHGPEPTAAQVRAAVEPQAEQRRRDTIRFLTSSESVEWYTPAPYVEAARLVMGGVDLDPASCAAANATVGATTFYTKAEDGLSRPWHGRVFLNPPYGRSCPEFVAKLEHECMDGNVTAAILLVSAYSTETKWFQPLFRRPVCFTDHRLDFHSPAGRGGSSTHGSAFVYFGANAQAFLDVFDQFGAIVCDLRAWIQHVDAYLDRRPA
jgi:hypothetical protein